MRYKEFKIENFKGIESIQLNLTSSRIITLVGLNESGKTTIMEALRAYYQLTKGKTLTEIEKNSFRPKGVDFTGKISLEATIEFEAEDIKQINAFIKDQELPFKIELPKEPFAHTHIFKYDLHNFIDYSRTAIFPATVTIKNEEGKYIKQKLYDYDKELWNKIIALIKTKLLPEILYYEDFVFSIPEDIVFSSTAITAGSIEDEKNIVWQLVLDDIIKSINPKFTTFKEMVVDIWSTDNETALNRISQVEEILNKKITNSWKELFQKESNRVSFKEIKISTKTDNADFKVSFKVKTDDGKLFSINDRSKGCRWFFSFLIFTEFRKNRTKNILFLLDEPASNLHSSAQTKILEAIKELSQTSIVIYSTHSHHLINPKWLSGTFVVINDKISDETLRGEMTFQDTSRISATKYFTYVGQGKGKTKFSYFQPILDALDYAPSSVEPVPSIIITEGKSDWYAFTYFYNTILKRMKLKFYPGSGRDSLGDIIKLYMSWGAKFVVVLDGDYPGVKSKTNYCKEFTPFLDDKVFTLKDILTLSGPLEDMFSDSDKKIIILSEFPAISFDSIKDDKQKSKDLLNQSINSLCFNKKHISITDETVLKFSKLFDFLEAQIEK